MAAGWLYDGESAVRRKVEVEAADGTLRLVGEAGEASTLDPRVLTHIGGRADAEVYGRADKPGWRIGIVKPVPDELGACLPGHQVYGRWIDRAGLPKAILAFALVSAGVLFAAHNAPALLAPYVPPELEEKFGTALVGDLGGKACSGAEGQHALDGLAAKLSRGGRPIEIRVVDLPMENAFALPGGHIVIFDPLIEEAAGPDEVAGVLAHEIAHIEKRHVTQALIRQYGLGILLAAVGGTTGGNVEMFARAGHSRAAENEADIAAIAALRRAGIDPSATAGFFKRVAASRGESRAFAYLSSHPGAAARRRRFEAAAEPGRKYQPALSEEEWLALWDICGHEEQGEPRILRKPDGAAP